MDEARAQRMVQALQRYGVPARVERAGVYQFGIAVRLDGDRTAIWDSDGTAALEAQIMGNGMLVGFVPTIPGSEDFSEEQAVAAIAATEYDAPVTRPRPPRPAGGGSTRPQETRPAARPAPRPAPGGGLLRRLFGGGR